MHTVDACALEHVEQQILIEIAIARWRGAYRISFARHFEVRRAIVGFGINSDGFDAHFVQRAQHAGGNGAAVCHHHFIKHL